MEKSTKTNIWVLILNLTVSIIIASITATSTIKSAKIAKEAVISEQQGTRDAFELMVINRLKELEEKHEIVRKEKIELEIQLTNIRIENIQLKSQLIAGYRGLDSLRAYINQSPVAMWLKIGPDLKMATLNKKYTELFGIDEENYIGKTDFDVWDKVTAKGFRDNDLEVVGTLKSTFKIEEVPINSSVPISNSNPTKKWVVIKYPVYIDNQLGVAGMAFSIEEFKKRGINIDEVIMRNIENLSEEFNFTLIN